MARRAGKSSREPSDGLVGISSWIRAIRAQIVSVAPHRSSVLIAGEEGTGKELIARSIHAQSPRAERPFIPVHCADIPGTLLASHLFGHLRGAFLGANYAALGCIRAADGGTLFLKGIERLDLDLQNALLRCLQQREVTPVGSHRSVPVDARVIAATSVDLQDRVAAGEFCEDLFYCLNVVPRKTAPLSRRREDIPALVEHFLSKVAGSQGKPRQRITSAAMKRLASYAWTGNVAELEAALQRAVLQSDKPHIGPEALDKLGPMAEEVLGPGDMIDTDAATAVTSDPSSSPLYGPERAGRWMTMGEVEREHIRVTLEHTLYNQTAASRLLEMDRNALRRKIQQYGLDTSQSRRGRPTQQPRAR